MSKRAQIPNYDDTVCEVCWQGTDDHKMLLCDECDCGFHTFCIGKRTVPKKDWYCPRCKPRKGGSPPPPPATQERDLWLILSLQSMQKSSELQAQAIREDLQRNRAWWRILTFLQLLLLGIIAGVAIANVIIENRAQITEWVQDLDLPRHADDIQKQGWMWYYSAHNTTIVYLNHLDLVLERWGMGRALRKTDPPANNLTISQR